MFVRVVIPLLVVVLTLFTGPKTYGQSTGDLPSVRISAEPKQVQLGERVTIEVRIELPDGGEIVNYLAPRSSGLQLEKRESKSVNRFGRVTIYRYTMLATKIGRQPLSLASIQFGDQTIASSRLSILVEQEKPRTRAPTAKSEMRQPAYSAPAADAEVILHAFSDKEFAWVGERLTVSWLLFTKTELLRYQPTPPSLSGLWSESLFEPSAHFDYGETTLDGEAYVVSLLSKRALYATRPGTLKIAPLSAQITTLRTPLGRVEKVVSNTIDVSVRSLPPAPPGFDSSYVGQFELVAQLDRSGLSVGQSATLSLQVSGNGAMGRLRAPTLSIDGFTSTLLVSTDSENSTESRVFQYWLSPQRAGSLHIPRIELIAFDPISGHYESSFTEELKVIVQPSPQLGNTKPKEVYSDTTSQNTNARDTVSLATLLLWCGLAATLLLLLLGLVFIRKSKVRH